MKVTAIDVRVLRSVFKEVNMPDQRASNKTRKMDFGSVLVVIKTDEGITGYGESFYRTLAGNLILAEGVKALGELLIGRNPLDVNQRWLELYAIGKRSGNYGALSALDEAMWDIKGKVAGRPVYEMLGGHTTPVYPYATYPLGSTEEQIVQDANWLLENGFSLMKIPAGLGVDEDIRRIKKLTPQMPSGFKLAIDANTTYSMAEALAVGQIASDFGLAWFEEPVEHMNFLGMAQLNSQLSIPIAGYQSFNTHYPLVQLLSLNAMEIYQPSLTYVGGITAGQRVGVLVESYGKAFVPHTMGPIINFVASLHVATAQNACTLIEFPILSRDLDNPGAVHVGPYMTNSSEVSIRPDKTLRPPDRPGLGVILDWDMVDKLTVASATIDSN